MPTPLRSRPKTSYDRQLPGRSADMTALLKDELASVEMFQDFWDWVDKLELHPRHPTAGA